MGEHKLTSRSKSIPNSLFKKTLLLIPFIMMGISCQTVNQLWQGTPIIQPSPTLTLTITASATVVPTSTLTPTYSPTPTATITPTPTIVITPSFQQLEIFDELWQIVRDEYLYPDFNGLDWNAIRDDYRSQIEAGMTDDNFYLAMDEMISRLGDDHSVFLSPVEAREEDAIYAGNSDYVGVGILVSSIPERDRAVILTVFPGSPANEAGLQPRDSILTVDGEPILDEDGFLRDILRGPEGSQVTLSVQTPGKDPRQEQITRRKISGAVPVPNKVLSSPSGKRIGYILLVTFNDGTIDDQVGKVINEMTSQGPLDGLIIDNRQNSGGADTILRGVLGYFTSGSLGYFISRETERPLQVDQLDINGSQQLPLVVLVGPGTASYGEVFSGVLKDVSRAYLIGETTDGNVETLWGYDFDDGSRAWLAHESFRPINHQEDDWEETGIIPDQTVIAGWDEYSLDNDPVVQAALEYFGQ
jgi:C-terminal peptidase prc